MKSLLALVVLSGACCSEDDSVHLGDLVDKSAASLELAYSRHRGALLEVVLSNRMATVQCDSGGKMIGSWSTVGLSGTLDDEPIDIEQGYATRTDGGGFSLSGGSPFGSCNHSCPQLYPRTHQTNSATWMLTLVDTKRGDSDAHRQVQAVFADPSAANLPFTDVAEGTDGYRLPAQKMHHLTSVADDTLEDVTVTSPAGSLKAACDGASRSLDGYATLVCTAHAIDLNFEPASIGVVWGLRASILRAATCTNADCQLHVDYDPGTHLLVVP